MDSRINSVNQDYAANAQANDLHDRIYCLGKYSNLAQENENPATQYELQNSNAFAVQESYHDPLAELMH
jgi:hypothetical protein